MKHVRSFGLAGVLAVLLLIVQTRQTQAEWKDWVDGGDWIRIIRAYKDGSLKEELFWIGVRKVGEKITTTLTTPAEPYVFSLGGNLYTLVPEEAERMETDRAYPIEPCPTGALSRFVVRFADSGPCVSGGPGNPDYTITRSFSILSGTSFAVKKKSP